MDLVAVQQAVAQVGAKAQVAGGSFTTGKRFTWGPNAKIPTDVGTAVVVGGAPGYANVLGNDGTDARNTGANDGPSVTTRDTTNFPQWTNWSAIWGGYDNIVNGWACQVQSYHSMIHLGSNHCTISGGSLHTIGLKGGVYSTYGTISGGTGHQLVGHTGTVGGGQSNSLGLRVDTIASGQTTTTIANTAALAGDVGSGVYGTNIPSGAYVTAAVAGTSWTISSAPTSTGTGTSVALGPRFDTVSYGTGSATIATTRATASDVGKYAYGTNIPVGTTVLSAVPGTSVTLSATPTGSGTILSIGQTPADTIGGGYNNAVRGGFSTVGGGSTNVIDKSQAATIAGGIQGVIQSDYGFVGGGSRNTINGTAATYATVPGGNHNITSGSQTSIGGGASNVISNVANATIAGGLSNNVQAQGAAVPGGFANVAGTGGQYALAMGRQANVNHYGALAHASHEFAANGDAQCEQANVMGTTTSTASVELFADNSAARLTMPAKTTWGFRAMAVGRRSDGGAQESAAFEITGLIAYDGTTCAIVGTPTVTTIAASGTISTPWTVAATADNTNKSLKLAVTGETSKTVRWVATVRLTSVTGLN